jgi:hypothetical protein
MKKIFSLVILILSISSISFGKYARIDSTKAHPECEITNKGLSFRVPGAANLRTAKILYPFSASINRGLYLELMMPSISNWIIGVIPYNEIIDDNLWVGRYVTGYGLHQWGVNDYRKINGSVPVPYGTVVNVNDVMQVAFRNGSIWFGLNGVWLGGGNPSTGVGADYSGITGKLCFAISNVTAGATPAILNFGYGGFTYTLPDGFVALTKESIVTFPLDSHVK